MKLILLALFVVVAIADIADQSAADDTIDTTITLSGEFKQNWRTESWFRRRHGWCRSIHSRFQEFDPTDPWNLAKIHKIFPETYDPTSDCGTCTRRFNWTRTVEGAGHLFTGKAKIGYPDPVTNKQRLDLSVYVGPAGSITSAGRTVQVRNHELKFSWKLYDENGAWEWQNLNGEIRFGLLVFCHESWAEFRAEFQEALLTSYYPTWASLIANMQSIAPDGDFDLAGRGVHRGTKYIMIDGVEHSVMNSTRLKYAKLAEHAWLFIYHLPHFTNTLEYDPSMMIGSSGTYAALIGGVVGGVAFLIIASVGGLFYCRRRRRLLRAAAVVTHA
jgi:hypothetical protein